MFDFKCFVLASISLEIQAEWKKKEKDKKKIMSAGRKNV